jgi:putative tricarboxylic transport membrane protein
MDTFGYLMTGFSVVFQPANLCCCFIGVLIGTLVGVLPGLGPVAAMSLLLPATLKTTPVGAIIMLSGIYYGAQYGGSTTSILVNIPGEAASVVTTFDGYQMARQGRAGPALGIAAFGSFIAGTVGIVGLMLLAPPLVDFALRFGPPEYFSLMVLGLTILTFLTSKSMIRCLMMAAFGIFIGIVGLDPIQGTPRFTFHMPELLDGVGLVPVVMGLFGIGEVLANIEMKIRQEVFTQDVKGILPTIADWARSIWAIIRGTFIGFFLGILPGGGAVIASFVSYAVEKRVSKHPEEFGKGAIEGVAGPESANNSAAQAAFVPLLTMGIPSNVVMAMLLGALIIHGITPGPLLITEHPDLFWGVIASMYIGNAMLLVLNLPLIKLWVQLLKVPYWVLLPVIVLFCLVGSYSINNDVVDMLVMLIFGVIGYLLKKVSMEVAPMVLAFVLGPMLEQALRQSLIQSSGSFSIFFMRPISATFLIVSIALLLSSMIPWLWKRRASIAADET